MPKPTKELIEKLGPPVSPFERRNSQSQNGTPGSVNYREDVHLPSHCLSEHGAPEDVHYTTADQLGKETLYLWLIMEDGLFVIREQTPHDSERGCPCHTNISGGENAYHGGELWFISEGTIVLNHNSGRYNHGTAEQKQAAIEYFEALGFIIKAVV